MKVLQLHCNFIEFEPIKKEIEIAEETEKKTFKIEDCLVLLVSVEKEDSKEISKKFVEEVKKSLDSLKINRIVIYPYAHLSKSLANPVSSLEILKELEREAKNNNIETYKAPFGWTKRLVLSIKGHPLAEQFKEIVLKEDVKRTIEKKYLILTKDGKLFDVNNYKFSSNEKEFKILVEQEALDVKGPLNKEPKFIEFLRKFNIEWEPLSDLGHMRYGPLGSFILDCLQDYINSVIKKLPFPVYFVKGTNMFNLKEKAIAEHASLFGQRMYQVELENKQFVLRYAACFQQFAMVKDWQISYKNLPFGMFEIADSYRFEQSGELLLSFRTRKLSMPDLHVFCKDLEQAKEVFIILHERIHEEMNKFGRKYVSLYNLTSEEFLKENIDFFKELLKYENYPVLISIYPKGINYYWILNIEYHIIDELNRAREIGTVQIDVGNGKRFGIKYIDKDGSEKHPIILHCAILGSLERFLYTISDNLVREEKPTLPLWISPIQLRIIPVSSKYLDDCLKIAELLKQNRIRVDIDDREETVEKRIREAEISLIPYIVVFGEKEKNENILSIRERKTGKIFKANIKEIIEKINNETKDYPFREINLPILVSKRPIF